MVVDPDHPDASDDNDGTTLPFLTLQRGLDELEPGDTLLIQPSDTPYHSDAAIDGTGLAGFALAASGTSEAPITIIGGQPQPVIDQGRSAAASTPVVGLLLNCTSHVIVRNLEIRNANDAGITTSLDGCATTDIRIESTHVHHIHGYDAVAGIRLANSGQSFVRANQLHDIYREEGPRTDIVLAQAETTSVVVERNTIRDTQAGVVLRSAGKLLRDTVVQKNRMEDVDAGIYLSTDVASGGNIDTLDIVDNLVLGAGEALHANVDRSGTQSTGVTFRNNTVADTSNAALLLSGLLGFESFNNIFANTQSDVLVLQSPRDASITNQVSYSDNNLIWNDAAMNWTLDLGGPDAQRFVGLDAWREAWSVATQDALTADPDTQTLRQDPAFADPQGGDYRPQNPAIVGAGRGGEDIGARTD